MIAVILLMITYFSADHGLGTSEHGLDMGSKRSTGRIAALGAAVVCGLAAAFFIAVAVTAYREKGDS